MIELENIQFETILVILYQIHEIYKNTNILVWNEIYNKFKFSNLENISENKALDIFEYLFKKKYEIQNVFI